MRFTSKQRKGAAFAITGLIGFFSGTFLPPEIITEIIGAF